MSEVNLKDLLKRQQDKRQELQELSAQIEELTKLPEGWEISEEVCIRAGCTHLCGQVLHNEPHSGDLLKYYVSIVVDDDQVAFRVYDEFRGDREDTIFLPLDAIQAAVNADKQLRKIREAERETARQERRAARAVVEAKSEEELETPTE